jgi:hypothetical protein
MILERPWRPGQEHGDQVKDVDRKVTTINGYIITNYACRRSIALGSMVILISRLRMTTSL